MVYELAFLKRNSRGQVLAELCLVLPLAVLIGMGILQLVLSAYGAGFARFAAFCALRSAAVSSPLKREAAAGSAAAAALGGIPGVKLLLVTVGRIPVPGRSAIDASVERLACRVRVKVPKVAPFMAFCVVEGGCSMRMEAAP